MKKKLYIILILVVGIISSLFLFYEYQGVGGGFVTDDSVIIKSGDYEKRNIVLGGRMVSVEVADTDAKRTRGLSGHAPLKDGEGMIFIFDTAGKYSFWMKDMLFPIDIIWIGEDFSVVDITENAEPNSYPNLFTPREEALYVLEVNAGFSNEKGLKIGDKVEFK